MLVWERISSQPVVNGRGCISYCMLEISESQAKYFKNSIISRTDNPSKVYVQWNFDDHDVHMQK